METLTKILEAREKRFALRNQFAKQGLASISLNLNIAGYPKSSEGIVKAFELILADFKNHLIACRIPVIKEKQFVEKAETGDFFIQPLKSGYKNMLYVKECLENFEETHELGRLIDADLFSGEGECISSGKLKKCLICDNAAKHCMKEQKHSIDEIRAYSDKKVDEFLENRRLEKLRQEIPSLALRAILYEVSLHDKPGLVCPDTSGSHKDMDYLSFVNSSAVLSGYFQKLVDYALNYQKEDYQQARIDLRKLGIQAEEQMFAATGGVNTQKGIIFLLGLSCFAVAKVVQKEGSYQEGSVRDIIRALADNLVRTELQNGWNQNESHGEKCFFKYGADAAGGIRREAELAFPIVFENTLIFLRKQKGLLGNYINNSSVKSVLLDCLYKIIAGNKDTNILFRKGEEELQSLQEKAMQAFKFKGAQKFEMQSELKEFCETKHLSPGGSADLLALTLFFDFIENTYFEL